MSNFNIINYSVVIVYLLAMMLSGLFFSKKEKNTEQYFLGGRKMPSFIIAISMYLALFSSISFVAVPGEAFQNGLSMSLPLFLTPIFTLLGFSIFVKFYFVKGTVTPFLYLENRFGKDIRFLVSIIFILMRLIYLGVVMYATAKYFKYITGWPIWITILTIGFVGIFYTTLGGIKAVIWTDFMQFFILVIGVGIVLCKISGSVDGGFFGVFKYAFEHNRGFEVLKDMDHFMSISIFERFTLWMLIMSMVGVHAFTYGCDQMTIQRLLCTSSYKEAKKATLVNLIISLPVTMIFWFIGIGLFCFYSTSGKILPSDISADEVLSYFTMKELPAPIPGLLMVALLTAAMSTINAGMNSLSAVFVKDIYLMHIRPDATNEQEMKVSKFATMIWGCIFVTLGITIGSFSENIVSNILEVSGIWGALFGIPAGIILLGVTTKRAHKGIIYLCSIISIIALLALVYHYYTADAAHRISFNIVGTSPFIVMVLFGYPLCLLWPAKKGTKSTEGLTLWSYKKPETTV